MKHTIKGVLYGHYDSRGGCTFIECENGRDEGTDRLYSEAFWLGDTPEEIATLGIAKQACDDDFLGEGTIETDLDVLHGQDIQDDLENELWVRFTEDDPANKGYQGSPGKYELRYGGECPEGFEESTLGEDAYGVVVLLREEGTYGEGTVYK